MVDTASLTLTGSHAALSAALAAFYGAAPVSTGGNTVPLQMPAPTMTPPMPSAPAGDDEDDGTPGAPAPAGGLDSTGLPWDGRIHSANKTTTAKGAWRKVKGVDAALVTTVEAELRRAVAPAGDPAVTAPMTLTPPPAPMAMPPMPPVTPVPVAPMPMPPVPTAPPVAPPMPAPVAPVAPTPPADPASLDFHGFMQHMSGRMQTVRDAAGVPLITVEYMTNLAKRISDAYQMPAPMTAITDLMTNPDKIAYAAQLVQHDGYWS